MTKMDNDGAVWQAAESGDDRALLLALRTRLAQHIDDPTTPARDMPSLFRQIRSVAKELKALGVQPDADPVALAVATPDETM